MNDLKIILYSFLACAFAMMAGEANAQGRASEPPSFEFDLIESDTEDGKHIKGNEYRFVIPKKYHEYLLGGAEVPHIRNLRIKLKLTNVSKHMKYSLCIPDARQQIESNHIKEANLVRILDKEKTFFVTDTNGTLDINLPLTPATVKDGKLQLSIRPFTYELGAEPPEGNRVDDLIVHFEPTKATATLDIDSKGEKTVTINIEDMNIDYDLFKLENGKVTRLASFSKDEKERTYGPDAITPNADGIFIAQYSLRPVFKYTGYGSYPDLLDNDSISPKVLIQDNDTSIAAQVKDHLASQNAERPSGDTADPEEPIVEITEQPALTIPDNVMITLETNLPADDHGIIFSKRGRFLLDEEKDLPQAKELLTRRSTIHFHMDYTSAYRGVLADRKMKYKIRRRNNTLEICEELQRGPNCGWDIQMVPGVDHYKLDLLYEYENHYRFSPVTQ